MRVVPQRFFYAFVSCARGKGVSYFWKQKIEVRSLLLFVDAAVRQASRTRRLSQALLSQLGGEVVHLRLAEVSLPALDEKRLLWRSGCCERGDFSDSYFDLARQFAAADTIVIAAPFWDLSFPALLKQYLEHICVTGLTFRYSPEGIPIGLCKARRLYYVTTSGGPIYDDSFGFGYVKALSQQLFGIADCRCIKAENLDIVGNDAEAILAEAISCITDTWNE